MKSWTQPTEDGFINVPDELAPLINKVAMQINFLKISGKNKNETICHIVSIAQDFFRKNPDAVTAGKE
jgi:hypothetical protein